MQLLLLLTCAVLCAPSDGLQNGNPDECDQSPIIPHPIFSILIALIPPRNYTLGISLTIALNIRGEPSERLGSVISQELLNSEIDSVTAYWKILSEYSEIEVTQELRDLVNKTTVTQDDLQRLVSASSCGQSSVNISTNYISGLWGRLRLLYFSKCKVTLNLGCGPQENSTTTEATPTESTTTETLADLTTEVRSHHKLSRQHVKERHHEGQDRHHDAHNFNEHGQKRNHKERKAHEGQRNQKN